MRCASLALYLMFLCLVCRVGQCHHRYADLDKKHGAEASTAKGRRSLRPDEDEEDGLPFSQKRFEKMLKKAILKIITGELSAADELLLKSFNYSHSDILAIRDWELGKKKDEEAYERMEKKRRKKKKRRKEQDEDLEAFNRQAVEDYENLETVQQPLDHRANQATAHQRFDDVMKPHVVFEIRYDDSEFDSNSDELLDKSSRLTAPKLQRFEGTTFPSASSYQTPTTASPKTDFLQNPASSPIPLPYLKVNASKNSPPQSQSLDPALTQDDKIWLNDADQDIDGFRNLSSNGDEEPEAKRHVYKGLEWINDDVYRVIPAALSSFDYDEENDTFDYDDEQTFDDILNDTQLVQGSSWLMDDPVNNLTSYQKFVLAQRRDQGQKAIEDIKLRVLVMTGRFNLTSNQVQKERLTMFSPSCQVPRNTDPEVWADPFSMNMYFQLNLTASDHIAAARLRIFNLPQENLTSSTSTAFDGDEEDEKKIRISVYFYTKALKKHRTVKKRLMDSLVTSLTSTGNHLALDVRQALRFWRRSSRYSHGNGSNHGLVVQVEDQDGRPLKPDLYIQQPSCQTTDLNTDEKAYQFVPALYIRACSRYVRYVNGEIETYFYCKKS